MFCTRLANGGLFPTGDPIVPFVISPRFECLNKLTHTHRPSHAVLWGLSIVLSFVLLLPNTPWLCAWKCPCPHNSATHTDVYDHTLRGHLLFFLLLPNSRQPYRLCTRMTSEDSWEQRTDSRGPIVPIEKCPRTVWLYKRTHTFSKMHPCGDFCYFFFCCLT